MFKRFFLGVLMLAGASFASAPEVHAQPAQTLDRILPEIRRSVPGNFSDAEGPITGANGQAVYRIKWITPDGRVIWLEADARTGRIVSQSGGGNAPEPQPGRRTNRFLGY